MSCARSCASCGVAASLTPPALPRPPVLTCALTTTRPPMRSAASFACCRRPDDLAALGRHPVLREEVLRLVLVQIHRWCVLSVERERPDPARSDPWDGVAERREPRPALRAAADRCGPGTPDATRITPTGARPTLVHPLPELCRHSDAGAVEAAPRRVAPRSCAVTPTQGSPWRHGGAGRPARAFTSGGVSSPGYDAGSGLGPLPPRTVRPGSPLPRRPGPIRGSPRCSPARLARRDQLRSGSEGGCVIEPS